MSSTPFNWPTPLESMKAALRRSIEEHGESSLSTRMLRAEITRWERDLAKRPKTFAEHYATGPDSTIGRRR